MNTLANVNTKLNIYAKKHIKFIHIMTQPTILNPIMSRLKVLISGLDVTAYRMAKDIGIGPSTFSRLIAKNNSISSDILVRIGRAYPSVNLHWLITGSGKMFMEDEAWQASESPMQYHREASRLVPRHMHKEYCQKFANAVFIADLPEISTSDTSGHYRYFECPEDSMQTTSGLGIIPGDIIRAQYISPDYYSKALTPGQIFILVLENEILVTQIREVTGTGLIASFLSPLYPDRKIAFSTLSETWLYRGLITQRPISQLT
jgi:plasmid maintenance system antidote protein VapI